MKIPLNCLNVGENFEISSLSSLMKNLTVLRSSSGSVLVSGDFRDDGKSWRFERNWLAPSCMVESKGTISNISTDNLGILNVEGREKGKRGRKSANLKPIVWPSTPFSFAGLAETVGVPYHIIANAFNKQKNRFKLYEKVSTGKRGKAVSMWQLQ